VKRVDLTPSPARQARLLMERVRRAGLNDATVPTGVMDLGADGDVVWIAPGDGEEPDISKSVRDFAAEVDGAVNDAQQAADDALKQLAGELESALGNRVDQAVVGTVDEYAVSVDPAVPPAEGWSPEPPEWSEGSYIWRRTTITYADSTSETSAPVVTTGNPGSKGEDGVVLRIDSSRGTVFKNSQVSTVLSVTILYGSQLVTDVVDLQATFGAGAYLEWLWRHLDDESFGVLSSDDSRISQGGFVLTVSPADVDAQVVFRCVLQTP